MTVFAFLLLALGLAPGVQGTVSEAGSLEPIAYATVHITDLGRRAVTDRNGYFVLPDLPAGRWALSVSAAGYETHAVTIVLSERTEVRIALELTMRPVQLEPVNVAPGDQPTSPGSLVEVAGIAGPAPMVVDAAAIRAMPALAEPDLFRALQMLPAVQAGSDFSSALYVRGGSPDQNLLTLDGAPLFNPYHLGGIFSAFDPDATRSVEILPGVFPASVGDRLSGAVNVTTRDGGRDRISGGGSVGLISSRLFADGPLPGKKGSFLFSGRRTYLDVASSAAYSAGLTNGTFPYAFSDALLKLTHDVGAVGKISASLYFDGEVLTKPNLKDPSDGYAEMEIDFDWGSRLLALNYWQPIGPSVTLQARAGVSQFRGRFYLLDSYLGTDSYGVEYPRRYADSEAFQSDLFTGADLVWHRSRSVHRLGVQVDRYHFDHDIDIDWGGIHPFPTFALNNSPTSIAPYLEQEWTMSPEIVARAGIRALHVPGVGTAWLPRVGARYSLDPSLVISVGAGRSAQALQSLRNSESIWSDVLAYDLVAGVSAGTEMPTSTDASIAAEWQGQQTSVRLDVYTKWMRNLRAGLPPDDVIDQPLVAPDSFGLARATSTGLELLASRSAGRATYSASYALAFAQIENAEDAFTPRFLRRHTLDTSATLPWGNSGSFSLRLTAGSGQPHTPVVAVSQVLRFDPVLNSFSGGYPSIVRGEHNSGLLPGYFRFDVGVRRTYERRWFGRETSITPYLNVLNIFNTPNALYGYPEFGRGGGNGRRMEVEYIPQMPIFPTFGMEWHF